MFQRRVQRTCHPPTPSEMGWSKAHQQHYKAHLFYRPEMIIEVVTDLLTLISMEAWDLKVVEAKF